MLITQFGRIGGISFNAHPRINANETTINTQVPDKKVDTDDKPIIDEGIITKIIIPKEELVYKNESAGYQITFPDNWKGNYVITEYGPQKVCIGFYGQSQTGQISFKHITGREGCDMFWIDSKPCSDCKIRKIVNVKGIDYSCVDDGRNNILTLGSISNPDSIDRQLARYKVDDAELELASQDLEKAKIMYEDIGAILKTFKAIE